MKRTSLSLKNLVLAITLQAGFERDWQDRNWRSGNRDGWIAERGWIYTLPKLLSYAQAQKAR